MAFQTRNSVFAIKKEVTEGTLIFPTAGSDFIALREGFSMDPAFDTLDNDELRSSIGNAKPIQGLENPAAEIAQYLRHSGVEGQAPDYGELIESAVGQEVVASTEFDTVAGSTAGDATTRAIVNVDTGEGVNFERGQALLIKDGTNGFNIRPVFSVSSDALSLGFNLDNAPGTSVNLGKSVLYKPLNTGHPTLSLFLYRANEANLEATAGARAIEMSIEISAGELITATFSLEGTSYFFDPVEIKSSDTFIDWTDDQGTVAASITAKTYKDPHDVAAALQSAMDASTSETITVVYDDLTGKFAIAATGTLFSLLWSTGSNTANTVGDAIGFVVSSDDTGSTTYTSDNAKDLTAQFTPSFDVSDPLVAKDNETFIGDFNDFICIQSQSVNATVSNTKQDVLDTCAESGKSGTIIAERVITVEVVALLEKFEADKFRRFRTNQETSFLYNFGTKSGGNWVAGKAGMIYLPTAVISDFAVEDSDGLVVLSMTLTSFVDSSGNGEFYINFV